MVPKRPMAPDTLRLLLAKESSGLSGVTEERELNCTGLERGTGGFLHPSGYFGPLSLVNHNSSSTVMGE